MSKENKSTTDSGLYSGLKFADDVGKAVATGKNAVKAAAKAGTGNVAGAALDVLKDEKLRAAAIATVLIFSFLLVGVFFIVGVAIIGTIVLICTEFAKNWNENWEKQGIYSSGNALYLYSIGAIATLGETIWETIGSVFSFITGSKTQNYDSSVHENDANMNNEEYEVLLDSVHDEAALVGKDGVLQRQIDAIKRRVNERLVQIVMQAGAQYVVDVTGEAVAAFLLEWFSNPLLYRGATLEINTDIEDSIISDAQAIKILAAYNVQHDGLLNDSDMWDLLDYCGWYGLGFDVMEPSYDNSSKTIYNSIVNGYFDAAVGDVVPEGTLIDAELIELEPPLVTTWSGTFAPQWYYEEMAVLIENNRLYKQYEAAGNTEALEDMIYFDTKFLSSEIETNNFDKLSDFKPYGIIDRLYSSTCATIVIAKVECEESGVWSAVEEWVESLINTDLKKQWTDTYESQDLDVRFPNCTGTVSRTSENVNEFSALLLNFESKFINYDKVFLEADGSSDNIGEIDIADIVPITIGRYTYWPIKFENLEADQKYTLYAQKTSTDPQTGEKIVEKEWIAFFTTFADPTKVQAYRLEMHINFTFQSVSVDELIYNMMGLWPGSLENREPGPLGSEYPVGQLYNDLMIYSWTDTYTASDGTEYDLEFTRQQGYQAEAYADMVEALCKQLNVDPENIT